MVQFSEFKLLSGNVGYLDISSFALVDLENPDDPVLRAAEAAMAMLANVDAAIIDLRESGGGTPEMEQFIASYFFDDTPRLLSEMYWGLDGKTYEFWTLEHLNGVRKPDIPLYILTSARTASAAEAFPYDLKSYGRGIIVGELTAGGGNPGSSFTVGRGFTVFISVGSVKNAVTGTNWDGVGVIPDVKTGYEQALPVAHKMALEQLQETNSQSSMKTIWEWTLQRMAAQEQPVSLGRRYQHKISGTYGTREVSIENGQLIYRRSARRPKRNLISLGDNKFAMEGFDKIRLEFEQDKKGHIIALGEKTSSGRNARYAKK